MIILKQLLYFHSIIITQHMKSGKNSCKYNKVTQQQKFLLLTLVLKEKLLIKEAAKRVGINYSTAKTIIFFNRNHGKSYQFDFKTTPETTRFIHKITATFLDIPINNEEGSQEQTNNEMIRIISTVGSKDICNSCISSFKHNFENQLKLQHSHSNREVAATFYLPHHIHLKEEQMVLTERRITRALSAKKYGITPLYRQADFELKEEYSSSEERSEYSKNA